MRTASALLLGLSIAAASAAALAQTAPPAVPTTSLGDAVGLFCASADHGWVKVVAADPWAQYLWYALVTSIGASLVANARGWIEKRAPWLMPIIDFIALNWREILAKLPAPPAVPPAPPPAPQQGPKT